MSDDILLLFPFSHFTSKESFNVPIRIFLPVHRLVDDVGHWLSGNISATVMDYFNTSFTPTTLLQVMWDQVSFADNTNEVCITWVVKGWGIDI